MLLKRPKTLKQIPEFIIFESVFEDIPSEDCIHLAFIVIPVILSAQEQE